MSRMSDLFALFDKGLGDRQIAYTGFCSVTAARHLRRLYNMPPVEQEKMIQAVKDNKPYVLKFEFDTDAASAIYSYICEHLGKVRSMATFSTRRKNAAPEKVGVRRYCVTCKYHVVPKPGHECQSCYSKSVGVVSEHDSQKYFLEYA